MKKKVKGDILHCQRQTIIRRVSDSTLLPIKSLNTSTCKSLVNLSSLSSWLFSGYSEVMYVSVRVCERVIVCVWMYPCVSAEQHVKKELVDLPCLRLNYTFVTYNYVWLLKNLTVFPFSFLYSINCQSQR